MNDIVLRVYGDSISLPRYGDEIRIEDTWLSRVQDRLQCGRRRVRIFNRSLGGGTIDEIFGIARRDEGYFPGSDSVSIVFLGIVDCAPRPIPQWLRNVISKFPVLIRSRVITFLHNHRNEIQHIKYYNRTPFRRFCRVYRRLMWTLSKSSSMVIVVGVGPVSDEMVAGSYGLKEEIARYSSFIRQCSSEENRIFYLDLSSCLRPSGEQDTAAVFLKDGHHYTKVGHALVGARMCDFLKIHIGA